MHLSVVPEAPGRRASGRRHWLFTGIVSFFCVSFIVTWIAFYSGRKQFLSPVASPSPFPGDSHEVLLDSVSDLGVKMIRSMYAVVPKTSGGQVNVTVVLTVWLKRVGARGGQDEMPHQAQVSSGGRLFMRSTSAV